jgi:hypothetical protein
MKHDNPKHRQAERHNFAVLLRSHHRGDTIYVDQIREYVGSRVVFYRRTVETWEQARVAVFVAKNSGHSLVDSILVTEG